MQEDTVSTWLNFLINAQRQNILETRYMVSISESASLLSLGNLCSYLDQSDTPARYIFFTQQINNYIHRQRPLTSR